MFLPGLWVALLALLLGLALRRWYDPVPLRCWLAWSAALAILFGPVLFAGRTLLPLGYLAQVPPFTGLVRGEPPGNLLQSDLVLQIAPWLDRVRESWMAGEWPLWNHLAGAGEPLLGNPQSQAFQPLVWLALPFPIVSGFGVIAALRVLLALVFTWLLLRRQGISEAAALAGSLAFALAGFLQLWLGWPLSGSAAFLPVLLYGIVLVDQRGERRDSLLLALATAGELLVGHPESGLHVAALAGLFALSKLLARPAGDRLRLLGAWVLAVGIGAGLAMPVVLPAAESLPRSLRAVMMEARHERAGAIQEDEENLGGARRHDPLARLIPTFAPNAFGNNRFGEYRGDRNIIEDAAGFAGTVALLAFLSSWFIRRRFPQERLMLGVALAALLVVTRPPGFATVLEALPVLRQSMTYHSRVALLLNFAVAYVAACAWERWRQGEMRLRRLLIAAAVLSLLIGWAYIGHPGPALTLRWGSLALQLTALAAAVLLLLRPGSARRSWGIAALVATELIAFHAPAHPPVPAGLYYPVTPAIAFVRERLDPWYRVCGLGPVLRPNFASVYGLADPRSSNPAKPAAYQEAIRPIDRFPDRATDGFMAPESPLYSQFGVRFLMTPAGMRLQRPYQLVFARGEVWIWRNRRALPRIFLPDRSSLELGEIRPADLRARVHLSEPQLLASSVYQDGNWKLVAGGARRPTTLANGPFVAASLPAGDADLALLYRPGSFVAGLAVAALALVAGAAFWAAPQTVRRSQARNTGSA
jgi:hypothetical protein